MPRDINHTGAFGVPSAGKGIPAVRGFNDGDNGAPYPERNLVIAGVTRDGNGNPLGNCALLLFDKADPGRKFGPFVSDAAGNYTIPIPVGFSQAQITTWKVDGYLPGSPDVAGTTVNTLVGT